MVLVTFNGDNWINKCLDSLYKSTVDFKLVINQDLEKINDEITMDEIITRFCFSIKSRCFC